VIRLETDTAALQTLARVLRSEGDGKQLRRGLTTEIRRALKPAVADAKAAALSIPALGGIASEGGSLRAAIARNVRAEARLSGAKAGARVRVRKRGMPRDFHNAPKRTNRKKGWRHPVWGNTERWVHQEGKPDWFDDAMRHHHPGVHAGVRKAMADTARRITTRKV
jgi:hypothetical protein